MYVDDGAEKPEASHKYLFIDVQLGGSGRARVETDERTYKQSVGQIVESILKIDMNASCSACSIPPVRQLLSERPNGWLVG